MNRYTSSWNSLETYWNELAEINQHIIEQISEALEDKSSIESGNENWEIKSITQQLKLYICWDLEHELTKQMSRQEVGIEIDLSVLSLKLNKN